MSKDLPPLVPTLALAGVLALGGCSSHEQAQPGDRGSSVVAYSGPRTAVDLDAANATRLTRNLFGMATGPAAGTRTTANPGLRGALQVLDQTLAEDSGVFAAAAGVRPLVSVMEDCPGGGRKIQTAGPLTLSVEYVDCRVRATAVSGVAIRVGDASAHTTTVRELRISSPRIELGFSGNFDYRRTDGYERRALDMVLSDGQRGRTLQARHLVVLETRVTDGMEVTVNGRLLDSDLGELEVETDDTGPLFYAGDDPYPSSGRVTLRGRGEERLTLLVLSNTQVNITADTDGDGANDIDQTLNWSELEAEHALG